MIELNLRVKLPKNTSPEVEEQCRVAIRRDTLRFVFESLNNIVDRNLIFVEGEVKTVEGSTTA